MSDDLESHRQLAAPLPAHREPPLIERARRIGWALLGLCLLLGAVWRFALVPAWVAGVAVACGLLGLLAIINVALVRGLYRQLADISEVPQEAVDSDV